MVHRYQGGYILRVNLFNEMLTDIGDDTFKPIIDRTVIVPVGVTTDTLILLGVSHCLKNMQKTRQ